MCTGAEIAVAAMIAGTATSAVGTIQQGQAQKANADYQAAVAENNAKMTEYQQQDAARRGEEQARQVQKAYAARIAAGRSGVAAGNLALDSGSAGLWEVGTEISKAEDLATVKTNVANDIWGAGVQGQNLRSEADMLRISGTNQRNAAYVGAGASLLAGAGQAGASYYHLNSLKPPKAPGVP